MSDVLQSVYKPPDTTMPDPQLLIPPAAASRDIAVGPVADRLLAQASTDLVTLLTAVPADDPVAARARAYVQAAKAPSTQRAYRSDWRDFERWCRRRDLKTLPAEPETVGLYIADLAATPSSGDDLAAADGNR